MQAKRFGSGIRPQRAAKHAVFDRACRSGILGNLRKKKRAFGPFVNYNSVMEHGGHPGLLWIKFRAQRQGNLRGVPRFRPIRIGVQYRIKKRPISAVASRVKLPICFAYPRGGYSASRCFSDGGANPLAWAEVRYGWCVSTPDLRPSRSDASGRNLREV